MYRTTLKIVTNFTFYFVLHLGFALGLHWGTSVLQTSWLDHSFGLFQIVPYELPLLQNPGYAYC